MVIMETITNITEQHIWTALQEVKDPEIPVISVVDMGMISSVKLNSGQVEIVMMPTFVGCPALHVIKKNIEEEVKKTGIETVEVKVDFENRWSSDRMSTEAREKLEKFGLAPPPLLKDEELSLEMLDRVRCPHCGSTDTTLRSSFGSTLCRAIRFCFSCKQGFEQFKPVQ